MENKEKKVAIGIAVGACAALYALGVMHFDNVLYPNTFINGESHEMEEPGLVSEGLIDNTKSFSIKTLQGTEKIDGAIACIMALDRAIRCGNDTSESVYDTRGLLVF